MKNNLNYVWKEYSDIEITHSIIHYLFSIDFLVKNKWYARNTDIANDLWITAWSCSISIKNLLKKEFIIEDENKFIKLSEKWEFIVKKANYKRNVIKKFFIDFLWVKEENANSNACKIEHLLSDEIVEKFKNFKK